KSSVSLPPFAQVPRLPRACLSTSPGRTASRRTLATPQAERLHWYEPEAQEDQRGEREVSCCEHPGRGVMEDNPVEPVADEIARISGLAALQPKRVLKPRQRAGDPDNQLRAYQQNHREVHDAEVAVSHPVPPCGGAGKDRCEAGHDKHDVCRMERRNDVGHYDPQHRMLTITGAARIGELSKLPSSG